MYSASLSLCQTSGSLQKLPRFIFTILVFAVILLLSITGRDNLLGIFRNFFSLLGYWNTSFFIILFTEHYLFRRGKIENYDLSAWDSPERLPLGYAGLIAFLMGLLGALMGMWQTWFIGPIAKMIGNSGADLGSELAFLFTIVTFVPLRWLERRLDRF